MAKVSDLPDHGALNPFAFRPCKPPATAAAARAVRGCGGNDALLKLRCTRDDKLAKATWGG